MSGHHHGSENLDRKFKIGLVLNSTYTVFEFIMGFASGSLALVSDAAHNLTDSLSLVVSFLANKISQRSADEDKTYGYGRASILAALLNAFILFGLAGYIFYEAWERFMNPAPVKGGIVMIVATVGMLMNLGVASLFYKDRHNINTKSAFLSMAYDALASFGALVAGLIILLTGKTIFDPIISVVIGLMLISSAWGVVKEALHLLLDGVPEGMTVKEVKQAISRVPGVSEICDLHVWAISAHESGLSCHAVLSVKDLRSAVATVSKVKNVLKKDFHIEHATIEIQLTPGPHDGERMDEGM
jgi:cobalt-zinc-cadmium efflux system protein